LADLLVTHETLCEDRTTREMVLAFVQERRHILHASARLPGEKILSKHRDSFAHAWRPIGMLKHLLNERPFWRLRYEML
jgi:hypothetical protein